MPTLLLISANTYANPYPVYPIGMSYLKTYLTKHMQGIEVLTFDMNQGGMEELHRQLATIQPKYVGISIRNIDGCNSFDRTTFVNGYVAIVDTVKRQTNATIILGGAGFSVFKTQMFETLNPHFAIQGEGEESLCQLLSALESNGDYTSIQGLLYRKDGRLIENKHTSYINRLELEVEDRLVPYYWDKSGMLNIQTKRGCCYNCIYCTYPLIDGRKIRTFEPEQVVDNLMRLQKDKGVDYVFFTDSVFNISNDYNMRLCEAFIRSGLKMRWGAYFSPANLPEELVSICRQAGLTHIEFGTESLSNEQLARYGKIFSVSDVYAASELCLKYNVYYSHFLILGGYGETEATIDETMENSKKMNHTVYFPFVGMRIYPNTQLHRLAVQEGLVAANDDLLEPTFYISANFNQHTLKEKAIATGKAWVFPDEPEDKLMQVLRTKKNKKGPIWEYLRK